MKKIIYLLIAIAFLYAPLLNSFANETEVVSYSEIYKKNKDAVAVVITIGKDNQPISQGSGFFITGNGAFVTNIHVLENAEYVWIKLQNGAMFNPTAYIGYDHNVDIVILKVDGKNLPFVELGSSYELAVGDGVLTIGSPHGLENSLSTGVVSAIREIEDRSFRFIQTTAEVSPGSSGGPLFNMKGKVIGVTTFIMGQGEALTFAIPIEYVKEIIEEQKQGKISEDKDIENSPEYYYFAGIIARDSENYVEASKYFKKAIELNERFDKPYYELADIYYKQKKFKEQKNIFGKLVSLRPTDPQVHYHYALALESVGDEIEAIREYKTALKFDPDNQDTLFNIGFLYILHDNYSEAEQIIMRLKSVNARWANQLERLLTKLIDKDGGKK